MAGIDIIRRGYLEDFLRDSNSSLTEEMNSRIKKDRVSESMSELMSESMSKLERERMDVLLPYLRPFGERRENKKYKIKEMD